jgi:hypothetical protein
MSKKKIEFWSQCRFIKEGTGDSEVSTVANIDAKQAKVGRRMTLKGVEGVWRITQASEPRERPNHGWGGMD